MGCECLLWSGVLSFGGGVWSLSDSVDGDGAWWSDSVDCVIEL